MTDETLPSASDVAHDEAYCSACNQSYPADTVTCPKDGARLIKLAAQRDGLLGRVLDGRYEIRAPLGKGGMGSVYRGWQLSVDREVAIKVIHPKLAGDRSAVKRFLREARLASRLSQPNIVNVYDFGQSDEILYIAMELLRGHTLAVELARGSRLDVRRTLAIALQLCDALEAAHTQGIVHRDLKPANILILDDPPGRDLIKVLDFGLAKSLVQDSGSSVTNSNAVLGTPLYMSPEQIEGRESDERADLYSLGCILFELLAGTPPFVDTSVSAVLARHLSDRPTALPPHVPAPLRSLVSGLLEKSPDDRPRSARDVRAVLDGIRDTEAARSSIAAPVASPQAAMADTMPGPALAETQAASAAVAAPPSAITPARPARRWPRIALLVVVPIAAIAVVVTSRGGSDRQHEATTPPDAAAPHAGSVTPPAGTITPADAPPEAAPEAVLDAAPPADARAPAPPRDAATPVHHTRPHVAIDASEDMPPIDFHH